MPQSYDALFLLREQRVQPPRLVLRTVRRQDGYLAARVQAPALRRGQAKPKLLPLTTFGVAVSLEREVRRTRATTSRSAELFRP